jgi:hypothetical protein
MRAAFLFSVLLVGLSAGSTLAATGAGLGPQSSWNQMQKFEYYLGDLAGALNLCRRFSLYRELHALASLSPYGRRGIQEWLVYDGVRGCPGLSDQAEDILEDKAKILEYLTDKYDCSSGDCVER